MQPTHRRPVTDLIRHVPRADQELPPEQQTAVMLRPMTLAERCASLDAREFYIRNPATGEKVAKSRDFTAALEACLVHIEAVENFPGGSNGQTRPWPKDGSLQDRLDYLAQFPERVLLELEQELFVQSELPPDAKNS